MVPPEKFTNFLNAHKLHRARQGLLLEIASRMPFQRAGEIIRMFSEVWGNCHELGEKVGENQDSSVSAMRASFYVYTYIDNIYRIDDTGL